MWKAGRRLVRRSGAQRVVARLKAGPFYPRELSNPCQESCAWAQPRRGRFAVMITSSARVSNAGGMIPSLCTLEIDNELEPGALLDVRSPELAPLRIRLPRS